MRLRNIPEARGIVDASPFVVKDPALKKGSWKPADKKELALEIGMGKGRFIIEKALTEPENFFVGMERYESVLFRACERMEGIPYKTPRDQIEQKKEALAHPDADPGLPIPQNLLFLDRDARELPDFFAPGEVDTIFLNFSDPWPKARHAKRRLTSHQFLSVYEQVLKDGGLLEFKTDNRDLFDFSVEEIKEAPHFELTVLTFDLHHDPVFCAGNIETEYEKKFSALGNKICKLSAVYHAG
ncbi:MAG: tRNA (guanosine(46)-N7)-methyltransferase TrmB [Lachnospiraceae bacterium]|nr:tRNA (guanosine(46)-N7)-methyltransferase TrmB [Lachnospiraceae bacterium]